MRRKIIKEKENNLESKRSNGRKINKEERRLVKGRKTRRIGMNLNRNMKNEEGEYSYTRDKGSMIR